MSENPSNDPTDEVIARLSEIVELAGKDFQSRAERTR